MVINKLKTIFGFVFPHTRINKSLTILVTANSILVFILNLFAPFYAVFVQEIGGNIAFAGLSWAVYSMVSGILIFLFSNWQLKVKEPELLIALGYVLRGGVFFSYALMNNIPQLILTQVLWGVATAIGTPAFDSVYSSHTSKENSIIEWGRWEGIAAIVTGFAALIGGVLIQFFGYPIIFIVMSIVSTGLGIYIYRLPREVL
ncbi:MAG: MFS transporter [Candidatus Shapirobacteria bacterium]|nr:MFS transporter [Candidatus Shapirobacteria bacterium]